MKTDEPIKVVTIGADELRALLRDVVFEVMAELDEGRREAPALIDRQSLARHLACSTATIHRMLGEGMPSVRIGDSRRFRLPEVLEWLKNRVKPPA
jgi:excisionase family DNA binding protein